MTIKPGGGNAASGAAKASDVVLTLSRPAAELLAILTRRADKRRPGAPDDPITQLAAGWAIGLRGQEKTIESNVQRARDEITDKTGQMVCARWSPPARAGMWLPANEAEEDEYIQRCLGRAYKTIARFRTLDRDRRVRIAQEIQGLLDLGGQDRLQSKPLRVGDPICPQCTMAYERRRKGQIYCTPGCRFDAARDRGSI